MKEQIQKRFKELFPNKRLLAVQLDGFSHRVIYDEGTRSSKITAEEWSGYCDSKDSNLAKLFEGVPHYTYQNNAQEIIYIDPKDR